MEKTEYKIVIPARYGAARLPGKPLVEIAGRPLIQHVYERATASAAGEVVVATDDQRVVDACRGFGAEVMLTRQDHHSGTDRVAEVISSRGWPPDTLAVGLQGDEPCMPPALLDQVASDLAARDAAVATLAYPIHQADDLFDAHVVKVVTDADGFALYFSRAPIPWHRDEFAGGSRHMPRATPLLRHIGLYAYRAGRLQQFVSWEPSPLEVAESLEQLRWLWRGERIHVGIATTEPGPGVDTAADVTRARACIEQFAGNASAN